MTLYVKLGAIILAVLVLFLGGFYFGSLKGKAALAASVASQAESLAKAYQSQQTALKASQDAYEHEIDELKTASLTYPTVAVRLCPNPGNPIVPVKGSGQDLPAGTGVLPPVNLQSSPGRDIGPELFQLADEADEIVAKCRAQ